jgi:hypothetical protein
MAQEADPLIVERDRLDPDRRQIVPLLPDVDARL